MALEDPLEKLFKEEKKGIKQTVSPKRKRRRSKKRSKKRSRSSRKRRSPKKCKCGKTCNRKTCKCRCKTCK